MSETVVVAGDVCIDWISIPIEPLPKPQSNWQIQSGRHMYAVPGGAWLTAAFLAAKPGTHVVLKQQRPDEPPRNIPLENVPPSEVIHSLLTLKAVPAEKDKKHTAVWMVDAFHGFAGPLDSSAPIMPTVSSDTGDCPLVVLDDSGNYFRTQPACWPKALTGGQPLILYKVRRPLGDGALCLQLLAKHAERLIPILTANDIRGEGGDVSRSLSWEQTAGDLVITLMRNPRFSWLRTCPWVIVTLGIEGAVLVRYVNGKVQSARLWYVPTSAEGEAVASANGNMTGFGSVFAACVAAELSQNTALPGATSDSLSGSLGTGIRNGILAAHRLLKHGFGASYEGKSLISKRPEYPYSDLFKDPDESDPEIYDLSLPNPPDQMDRKVVAQFKAWRILDGRRSGDVSDGIPDLRKGARLAGAAPLSLLAHDVAIHGLTAVLADVPVGKFAKFETIDRSEIESYRSVRNLIREFMKIEKPERPLCLAVFGPPGAGKSFGVKNVAVSVASDDSITPIEFNVSQWTSPTDLVRSLHRVRDEALKGNVPLVFFDEFDSPLNGTLGWLKYFLAPMQDGLFSDALQTHLIGKSIFIFAGGTAATFNEFRANAEPTHPKADEFRAAKLPDFLSRLRGHIDVFGLASGETNLIRRALVLRGFVMKSHRNLVNVEDQLQIDSRVLNAFLCVPRFHHGARSIEAVLDMCRLEGSSYFDPSALPSVDQLNLHTDGRAFMTLVRQPADFDRATIDALALKIHANYVIAEKSAGTWSPDTKASHREDWDDLRSSFQRSNLEQAAYYPTLLSAVGCGVSHDNSSAIDEFKEDLDKLATMEHERWLEERKRQQPGHGALVPWEWLSEIDKDRDRDAIRNIPKNLSQLTPPHYVVPLP